MSNVNPMDLGDQLMIFSVGFGPDAVEIDFLDPRRQARGLNEITKLSIERSLMRDEIEFIEEHIRDLIDEALQTRNQ